MKKLFAILLSLCVCTSAYAQYQTPVHSVPIGKGGGISGFNNALPGVSGGVLTSNGASADPSFRVPNATTVPTIAALKALDTTATTSAYLTAAGRAGNFVWTAGNYTTAIAADTNNGVYVKANAIAASSGAWVRQFDFVNYDVLWFGPVADYATDNSTLINTVISTANAQNVFTTPGRQAGVYVNVPSSVRFSSSSLSYLPATGYVYVYVSFFANSDLTKGIADGSGGSNERHTILMTSGYPGDPGGGVSAEIRYRAVVHPGLGVQQDSTWAGGDNHIACSVPLVLGQCLGAGQTRVPTSNTPVNASLLFFKDNTGRALITQSTYGDNSGLTGLTMNTIRTDVSLAGQAGFSTTAWCAGACIPTTGDTIQGATSGALGYLTTPTVGDTMQLRWLSGVFLPGEFVKANGNTSTATILGGGVGYSSSYNNALWFGVNTPGIAVGMPGGETSTAFTVGGRLTLTTTARVFHNKSETVTNAGLLFSNSTGIPTTGRQVVLNSSNRLVTVSGVTNGTGSTGNGLVGAVAAFATFAHASVVSANSFNVATVTPTPPGVYAVAFTNALANANYTVSVSRTSTSDYFTISAKTTTGFTLNSFNSGGAATNLVGSVDVTVTGGQ